MLQIAFTRICGFLKEPIFDPNAHIAGSITGLLLYEIISYIIDAIHPIDVQDLEFA